MGTLGTPGGERQNFGNPPRILLVAAAKIAPGSDLSPKTVAVTATPNRWLSADVEDGSGNPLKIIDRQKTAVAVQ